HHHHHHHDRQAGGGGGRHHDDDDDYDSDRQRGGGGEHRSGDSDHHHSSHHHHHPHQQQHSASHHGHPPAAHPPQPPQHHHHPHHHHHHPQQQHPQQQQHLLTVTPGGGGEDGGETDSAYSDNASLPSSESFTSMATVSSSADTTSSSSGETCSMSSALCGPAHAEEEQLARMKAEKIRIALEKIKDAKIRKLFVRAFAKDGSSKSILVDEKMSVNQVCSQLADKNHVKLNHTLSVVEHMPELLMERILEDHDSLVESMVMWTRDSKNKVMFEERMDKYDLFRNPEKYLLNSSTMKTGQLTPQQKDKLIQDFFAPDNVCVPSMEGALYLKSDGKKAWKKFFFVLRASGLYYNPKGKASKNPKDLVCLVQFEYVEVYRGLGWKKKYHAPTDYCFALKHPQIQKKTSKYIRYFCADSEVALDQWVMGVRTVKLGKQMLHNYEHLTHEISMWDMRPPEPGGSSVPPDDTLCRMLNHADLSDSRMSVPEPGSRHSVIQVHNSTLVRNSASMGEAGRDVMSIEVLAIPPRKGSESGGGSDGRSLSGSVGSSSLSSAASEAGHKTPVKRVSFSATHSIINGDSGEQTVKHRDSIISASTDSSEDSNSSGGSGEARLGASFRGGKMRPKLPLTTETTRQLADMCNVTVDETPEAIYAETPHHHYSRTNSSSSSSSAFTRSERRRASMTERRGSCGSASSDSSSQRLSQPRAPPLSPPIKQHSVDSGTISRKQNSPVPEGASTSRHVRRKSESSVSALIEDDTTSSAPANGSMYGSNALYSTVYSSVAEETGVVSVPSESQQPHADTEPLYNQIRSPTNTARRPAKAQESVSAIPPPPQFREDGAALRTSGHEPSPPLPPPPPPVASMQVPPPPPPIAPQSSSAQSSAPPPPPLSAHLGVKESLYSSITSSSSSAQSAKSSPPPTLPKPQHSNHGPISAPQQAPPPPPVSAMSQPPPPPPPQAPAAPPSSSTAAAATAGLPKHPPPPPPLRMASHDSIASSQSGFDSTNSSPRHIPMPPPMPPITPKLPPPTLPKSSPVAPAPNLPTNTMKTPPPPPPPGPPGLMANQKKKPGAPGVEPKGKPPQGSSVSNTSSLPHNSRFSGGQVEDLVGCPQSPSLPFLSELSKRSHPDAAGADKSGVELRNGQSSPSAHQHRRSASAGGGVSKGDRKAPPPPPPKRSENTRLSADVAKPPSSPALATADPVQNGASGLISDPIYENYDGIMDIDELPPPPPELLVGLSQSESDSFRTSGSGKKPKPPPPPPKRSKDTQLSSY
ncbi:ras-associated and pleckstrin homology domains-containing protein 1, partial [Aplysia californica]|uniref:Ras-associated and pleckstrin homology domains-containing protein 1 n=1 Tax=Aplysia californica TaxID=6500 RepID=A0ABM1AAQ0_APLCA